MGNYDLDKRELEGKIQASMKDDNPEVHIALLAERSRRSGFDLEESVKAIIDSAQAKRFLAYSDIPDPSNRSWPQRRYQTWGHLQDLVLYCHAKALPLMSSIVVEKKHRKTGEMAGKALSGFLAASRNAGYVFEEPRAFFRDQQKRTFRFAGGLVGGQSPMGPLTSQVDLQRLLLKEGELSLRVVKTRSRSCSVRELCVEHHGSSCLACGLAFGERFGDVFAGLIEVHHKNPFAELGSRHTDPRLDCFPLCPNCHRMAHHGMPAGKCRSLDELRAILSAAAVAEDEVNA